jgi:hypothetical protein
MPREWSDASGIKGSGESTFIQSQHRFLPENHIEFWTISHWHFHKHTHTHTEIEIEKEKSLYVFLSPSHPGNWIAEWDRWARRKRKERESASEFPKSITTLFLHIQQSLERNDALRLGFIVLERKKIGEVFS